MVPGLSDIYLLLDGQFWVGEEGVQCVSERDFIYEERELQMHTNN